MLAHWNNSLRVDMLFHSDILSWFRTNQSLILRNKAAYLVWPKRNSNPQSTSIEESTLTITPPMYIAISWEKIIKWYKHDIVLYYLITFVRIVVGRVFSSSCFSSVIRRKFKQWWQENTIITIEHKKLERHERHMLMEVHDIVSLTWLS